MRIGRQDLNINFFTFRSCHPLDGRQALCRPFLKISLFGVYFWNFIFLNIKMKKAHAKNPCFVAVGLQDKWKSIHLSRTKACCCRNDGRSPEQGSRELRSSGITASRGVGWLITPHADVDGNANLPPDNYRLVGCLSLLLIRTTHAEAVPLRIGPAVSTQQRPREAGQEIKRRVPAPCVSHT